MSRTADLGHGSGLQSSITTTTTICNVFELASHLSAVRLTAAARVPGAQQAMIGLAHVRSNVGRGAGSQAGLIPEDLTVCGGWGRSYTISALFL